MPAPASKARRAEIVRLARSSGLASVEELSAQFGVTASTIRRDLSLLTSQGLIARTYGGAIALQRRGESSLRQRALEGRDAKRAIALWAAHQVQPGETILLDAGTTVGAMGEFLCDVPDLTVVTAGLTALVLPLVEGRAHGWPAWTIASLAIAPVILGAFVAQQRRLARRGGAPMLDPALFRDRAFGMGLLNQLVFWGGQASFFLVLALYLQQGRGLDALQAGLVFTILAVAYLATSLRAPALTMVHGRRLLLLGALTLAAGHGALLGAVEAIGTGGTVLPLVPGLLLVGAGMGLVITPLTTVVMGSLGPEHAGAASGGLSTMQNVGNALGVAVIGVIFFGAAGGGFDHAFALSAAALAGLLVAVAALTRLLPAPAPRS